MKNKKRIVIVGATSTIAEHCARLWVDDQQVHLILVGRDVPRVKRIAADLKVRSPLSEFEIVEADFITPEAITATVESIMETNAVDVVLIAHGSLSEQNKCQDELTECCNALYVNGISPILFTEAFAKTMEKSGHGTIAIIGSVAGDRGRKSNYIYGAAKGLVARYAQGLQHRFADSGVNIILIKPGPTATRMTADLKVIGAKLAPVESVAKQIVIGIQKRKSIIYAPRKWALIMFIIKHLPDFVFNKMNV